MLKPININIENSTLNYKIANAIAHCKLKIMVKQSQRANCGISFQTKKYKLSQDAIQLDFHQRVLRRLSLFYCSTV